MTRRHTYGRDMAIWERHKDEIDWQNRFEKALSSQNYILIERLVEEGFSDGYSFPSIEDTEVLKIIKKHHSK